MKGSLKKRGQYWYVIVDTKDEEGKRKQQWINTHCERKPDAEKELRSILTKIDQHIYVGNSKVLFCDFLTDWLNNIIQPNIEVSTFESYKITVYKHLIPYFSRLPGLALQDISPAILQKYFSLKHKGFDGRKPLSGNTLRKHLAVISGSLNHSVRMNLIAYNPSDRLVLPKKEKFIGNYYSSDELEILLQHVANTPIEAAVFITVYYGLRRSEVLGLKWNAIDFKEKLIHIKESRVRYANSTISKKPKNDYSIRTLPLIKNVGSYLKTLKMKQEDSGIYSSDGYVCLFEDGTPLEPQYLSHKFQQIINKCGLPKLRYHDLRHSTASYLLKIGLPMKEIQVWLGHGDIGTTMNIYSHVSTEMTKNTAKKLNKMFTDSNNKKPL